MLLVTMMIFTSCFLSEVQMLLTKVPQDFVDTKGKAVAAHQLLPAE